MNQRRNIAALSRQITFLFGLAFAAILGAAACDANSDSLDPQISTSESATSASETTSLATSQVSSSSSDSLQIESFHWRSSGGECDPELNGCEQIFTFAQRQLVLSDNEGDFVIPLEDDERTSFDALLYGADFLANMRAEVESCPMVNDSYSVFSMTVDGSEYQKRAGFCPEGHSFNSVKDSLLLLRNKYLECPAVDTSGLDPGRDKLPVRWICYVCKEECIKP
jgi:hypothetical protein